MLYITECALQNTVEEALFWDGMGELRKQKEEVWKKLLSIGFEHTHQVDYADYLAKGGIPDASVQPIRVLLGRIYV